MTRRYIPGGYEDEMSDDDLFQAQSSARVRVLPGMHIGAGLNGTDFDASLSTELKQWLQQFIPTAYKRTPQSSLALKEKLLSHPQPTVLVLKLLANTPGCNNLRNRNVANFILEVFCDLSTRLPELTQNCDDNTRMVAFNFVKNCGNRQLLRAVMETFQMQQISEPIYEKIRELLQQKKYTDAAYCIIQTKLTERFNHLEVLFPLVLQDKINIVYEYLDVASAGERELFVSFLDSLLDRTHTVVEHCDEILHEYRYADVKYNMLKLKPISKMVLKLAERYQLPPPENVTYNRACSFITFQFHNFKNGEKSLDAYRELVRDMANTQKVQHYFVQKLTDLNDLEEAVYWAREFKLDLGKCPREVQIMFERGYAQMETSNDNAADLTDGVNALSVKARNRNEYLALSLPKEAVLLVDNRDKFIEMLQYLKQQQQIGFDSEWKPTYNKSELVSLVQLGCWERVYLLDCMSAELTPDLWCALGCDIFNNVQVLKIGFSLDQDLRMLQKSLPLNLNLSATRGYLDLHALYRHLKYMQILDFPFGNGCDTGESLSALSELCLGKKLDKLDQCSNWANRPLRAEQISYAALDAHCLLQIYRVLIDHLNRIGYNPNEIVEEVIVTKNNQLVSKTKRGNTDVKVLGTDGNMALMATQRKKLGDKNVPASQHNCSDASKQND